MKASQALVLWIALLPCLSSAQEKKQYEFHEGGLKDAGCEGTEGFPVVRDADLELSRAGEQLDKLFKDIGVLNRFCAAYNGNQQGTAYKAIVDGLSNVHHQMTVYHQQIEKAKAAGKEAGQLLLGGRATTCAEILQTRLRVISEYSPAVIQSRLKCENIK